MRGLGTDVTTKGQPFITCLFVKPRENVWTRKPRTQVTRAGRVGHPPTLEQGSCVSLPHLVGVSLSLLVVPAPYP